MEWSFVACGNVDPAAQGELALRLGELLSSPQFGTGHSSLVIGSDPPASAIHVPEFAPAAA